MVADLLRREKADVTLLEGAVTHKFKNAFPKTISFRYFDELARLLKKLLTQARYDIVIHAAAVSDYALKKTSLKKVKSGCRDLPLVLTPTPKLISKIKRIAPRIFLVGFKLETFTNRKPLLASAKKLIGEARCDLVVANTLNQNRYHGYVINKTGDVLAKASSRKKIARSLVRALKENT